MFTAQEIARVLGGVRSGAGFVVRCPVPNHGRGRGDRTPSLSIHDGDSTLLVQCKAGCNSHDVLKELRRRGLLDDSSEHSPCRPARKAIAAPNKETNGDNFNKRRALQIWKEAVNARGTIVEQYLRKERDLVLPEELVNDKIADEVLRFHPACPWGSGAEAVRVPAMIALFRHIVTNEPRAIHRTRFDAEGRKIGRLTLGPSAGCAIKIDNNAHVTQGLCIGEGIETCLAARQLGLRPVWACGSATAIASFPDLDDGEVLAGLECLTIFAETDDGGANARAIEKCGRRWRDKGREVLVVRPRQGDDINAAIMGVAR